MKKLSRKTIERTLLYVRALEGLIKAKQNLVSSRQLAQILGSTDVQIRKEISNFGKVGRPRVGYDTAELKRVLQDYLLQGKIVRVVLFGVGNLGRAILRYPGFHRGHVKLVAAFDQDPKTVGRIVEGIRVYSIDQAPDLMKKVRADIGIIAVPEDSCQAVADLAVLSGLRGIVNFAPKSVSVPKNVFVSDIDLTIEFLSLYCDIRFRG